MLGSLLPPCPPGLHLGDALRDEHISNVLVAHMLLEDWTNACEQCTEAVPKRPGKLMLPGAGYAAAYMLLAPDGRPTPAGRALAVQLAEAAASGK